MKLLYITSSLPIGTQETFIIPEIRALVAAGHDITVVPVHPRGGFIHDDARSLLSRSLVIPLISPRLLAGIAYPLRHPADSLGACGALLTHTPRHFPKNCAALLKAFYLARTIDLRSFDHIHAHWAATSSSLAMALHRLSGVPWSFTAHRWDIVDNNLLGRKMVSASFIRLISRSGLALVRSRVPGAPKEKIHLLPMGVDIPAEIPVSRLASPDRPFILICPANLLPVKGHRYLIEAMASLKKIGAAARLIIAGSGPLEGELRALSAAQGVSDRIEFPGRVSHGRLLSMYTRNEVDAAVLPSIDLGNGVREGIPVALIEAMAHGLPVISTDTGGIPELIEDGAGIMVPERDPAALAEAITRLSRDTTLRRTLAEKGRAVVQERFAMPVVSARLTELFEAHR